MLKAIVSPFVRSSLPVSLAAFVFILSLLLHVAPSLAATRPPATEEATAAETETPAAAQPAPAPISPETVSEYPPGVTPRSTLFHFFDALREGKRRDAATALGNPQDFQGDPEIQASRLKSVFDTFLWFDLPTISDDPRGRLDDGLPPDVEDVGPITIGNVSESVLMQRLPDGRWVFAPTTVARIDRWYELVPDRWIREHLPEPLLRPGPGELMWWQWLAIPGLILVCLLIAKLLCRIALAILRRLTRRTEARWDDLIIERLYTPAVLFTAVFFGWLFLPLLSLTIPARGLAVTSLQALVLAAIFWAALRIVDFLNELVAGSSLLADRPQVRALLPLGSRVLKLFVAAVAAVTVLQKLGYPVASIIAGLGIGGLAIALAAQKTVENFIGSVTLSVDQPFRPGDFVGVSGIIGTVETVGIRSTRIRTLNRTLVTIPNAKLAEEQIESYAVRDRLLFLTTLRLVYSTKVEQLRTIVRDIEEMLRGHPQVFPDVVRVVFKEIAPGGFEVEIFVWFQETDWTRFLYLRQELLFNIMEIVERNGSALAVPAQVVHLKQGDPRIP